MTRINWNNKLAEPLIFKWNPLFYGTDGMLANDIREKGDIVNVTHDTDYFKAVKNTVKQEKGDKTIINTMRVTHVLHNKNDYQTEKSTKAEAIVITQTATKSRAHESEANSGESIIESATHPIIIPIGVRHAHPGSVRLMTKSVMIVLTRNTELSCGKDYT